MAACVQVFLSPHNARPSAGLCVSVLAMPLASVLAHEITHSDDEGREKKKHVNEPR